MFLEAGLYIYLMSYNRRRKIKHEKSGFGECSTKLYDRDLTGCLLIKVVHCTEGSTFYDPTLQYGVDFNILWYCFYWSNWLYLYIIISQWSKTLVMWTTDPESYFTKKSLLSVLCTQVYSLHVTPSFIIKLFRYHKIIMNHL